MLEKRLAGEKAAEFIKEGMTIGLGTGSTAYYAIKKVGQLVSQGLKVRAVATSKETERLAKELGIPLYDIDEVDQIDLDIDGVDEIDPDFNAIKGGGGALFREKIIASRAKQVIWIMDESKLVREVGAFPLPVEVLPFGYKHTLKRLEEQSYHPVIREKDGKPFVTDNGNFIIDLHMGSPMDIQSISKNVSRITGVLESGLFLNMCDRIIIGKKDGTVEVRENQNPSIIRQ